MLSHSVHLISDAFCESRDFVPDGSDAPADAPCCVVLCYGMLSAEVASSGRLDIHRRNGFGEGLGLEARALFGIQVGAKGTPLPGSLDDAAIVVGVEKNGRGNFNQS